VRPGRAVVPVGVPELEAAGPVVPLAEDGGPLVVVGIDTGVLLAEDADGGIGKLVEEGTVALGAAEPEVGSLNIDPHLTVLEVLDSIVEGLDLAASIAALGAREHVKINMIHATSPRIVHRGSNIGINLANRHVATDDRKLVAVVADALPARHREELRDINTSGRKGSGDQGSKNNKRNTVHVKNKQKQKALVKRRRNRSE